MQKLEGPKSRVSLKQSNFLFSVRAETNRNSICFGCFSVCFAKPKNIFFSVCLGLFRCFELVTKQPKQTEFSRNKPKKSQKNLGVLENVHFSLVRTEKNLNLICFGCFLVCFSRNPPKNFSVCFNVSDRYRNYQNKQNLWSGEFKRLIF
jgi:hypothetical protein